MKKDDFKTDVMFRKEKSGDILAVFPYDIADPEGNITGYTHLGQHTAVCWDYVLFNTKPAKQTDFKQVQSLISELKGYGYNLNVVKKRNYNRFIAELNKIR